MATPPVFVSGAVLTAAQMSAIGFWVVKPETAFTSVTDVTADGVFTSDFTNYRLLLRYSGTTGDISVKFRVATVDTSTGYNFERITANGVTITPSQVTATTSANIAKTAGGAFDSFAAVEISGPQLAAPTLYQSFNTRQSNNFTTGTTIEQHFGNQSSSTSFDGIKILAATASSLTGTFTIYGYNK